MTARGTRAATTAGLARQGSIGSTVLYRTRAQYRPTPRRVGGCNLINPHGLAMPPHFRSRALVAIGLLTLAACGTPHASTPKASPSPTDVSGTAAATPSAAPTPTPAPTPAPLNQPLMVQVENLYVARPQSGLSTADIVYEYQTEGGISRFTGIWYTPPPAADLVGPVRSARPVDLRLLQIYDGALLYSGASNYTQAQLNSSGMKQYSPNSAAVGSTVLYRVSSSSAPPSLQGAPHNLYSNGSVLATFEQKIGLGPVSYHLWTRTAVTSLPAGGTAATIFQVPISPAEDPRFTYDPTTGAYQRSEPATTYPGTGTLDDADTKAPWETPNVVILQAPVITVSADNEDSSNVPWVDGLDFGIGPNATGSGQLAVGGQLYGITWTQGASGPPQLTLANGQPAPIAAGQVMIELVGPGVTAAPQG